MRVATASTDSYGWATASQGQLCKDAPGTLPTELGELLKKRKGLGEAKKKRGGGILLM